MRKILNLVFLLLFMVIEVYSQIDSVDITFKIISPGLNDSSTIFITGNHPSLGNWRPDNIPLIKNDKDSAWYLSLYIPRGLDPI